MSGIIGRVGSKSGVIGQLDDAQRNAWHIFKSAPEDIGSGYLDFDSNVFIGSNVTESAGKITVNDSGIYSCAFSVRNEAADIITHDWEFFIDDTKLNGTRVFFAVIATPHINYIGGSMSVPIRLNAGEELGLKGNGNVWGNSTSSMTFFSGIRIGNLS